MTSIACTCTKLLPGVKARGLVQTTLWLGRWMACTLSLERKPSNPESGISLDFQPMASGTMHAFSRPEGIWLVACCHFMFLGGTQFMEDAKSTSSAKEKSGIFFPAA